MGMGYDVVCLDNLLTGNTNNIAHLMGNPRFTFIKYNVVDYLFIEGAVDAVLHFASPASPIDYLEMPIQTLKVGSLGTHKALGLAKEKKARFLLASTSEVYGDPHVNPQPETYWGNVNPIGPRGVYDEAKRFAEAMTMAYRRYHSVDARIVRIFNTYGPRMRPKDGRVVSNFIVQALKGNPLTVYGDGMQTRSFCFVSDLVSGILALLSAAPSDEMSTPFNIGNPEERTVKDLATKILALTGSASRIEYRDLPVDDPHVRCPDITRAKTILGWRPEVGIDQGLQRTIEYFRKLQP
jgi:dTDP-glucose 4,6-dehydratase